MNFIVPRERCQIFRDNVLARSNLLLVTRPKNPFRVPEKPRVRVHFIHRENTSLTEHGGFRVNIHAVFFALRGMQSRSST